MKVAQNINQKTASANKKPANIKFTGTFNKVLTSKKTFYLSKFAEKNPSIFGLIVGTVLATTIRPLFIMAIPGAEKQDKQYASAKSIISGVVSLFFNMLISMPISKHLEKFHKKYIHPDNLNDKFKELLTKQKNLSKPLPEYLSKIKTLNEFTEFTNKKFKVFKFLASFMVSFTFAPIIQATSFQILGKVMKKLFPKTHTSNPKKQNSLNLSNDSKHIFINFVKDKDDKK